MNMLSRREALCAIAMTSTATALIGVPPIVKAAAEVPVQDRAEKAWREFCAAVEEALPSDTRLVFFGSHYAGRTDPSFQVHALRTELDEARPGFSIPVERYAGAVGMNKYGWFAETPESRFYT